MRIPGFAAFGAALAIALALPVASALPPPELPEVPGVEPPALPTLPEPPTLPCPQVGSHGGLVTMDVTLCGIPPDPQAAACTNFLHKPPFLELGLDEVCAGSEIE